MLPPQKLLLLPLSPWTSVLVLELVLLTLLLVLLMALLLHTHLYSHFSIAPQLTFTSPFDSAGHKQDLPPKQDICNHTSMFEQGMKCLENVVGEEGLATHANDRGGVSAKRTAGEGVDLAFTEARGHE